MNSLKDSCSQCTAEVLYVLQGETLDKVHAHAHTQTRRPLSASLCVVAGYYQRTTVMKNGPKVDVTGSN